jgi:c-di-GMP-binding flagellar brake protein YcgR
MNENDPNALPANERRAYFRIEDSLNLSYHEVPAEALEERLQRLEQGVDTSFTVLSSLASISQQMGGVLHKIQVESPDIARYLKALDQKIELLGRTLLATESNLVEQHAHPVNLSASGMAFKSKDAVEPGITLELRLLLYPSLAGILAYAEVVDCVALEEADSGFAYCIRVNFSHLRESDRDLLIRHVVQRQTDQLRKAREERESSQDT